LQKSIIKIFLSALLLIACNSVFSNTKKEPLIIFHIDLNSVSLKEDYIKKWLKNASVMGYNAILWEVENEIQWETCPECVSPDAFSKDEFRELLNYSRQLGLESIPLLQTIGHAEYVLQHEKYIPFRENPEYYDCYCTSNPEVRKFLKNWIVEYLEIFGDIKYFHLGGDEAYRFGSCQQCSLKIAEASANQLYAEHIIDISQPLLEKGIRPGIWNDMILKQPDNLSVIPKNFVFWDWNYWDGDGTPDRVMVWSKGDRFNKENITDETKKYFPDIIDDSGNLRAFYTSDMLKDQGYDVILCSSSRSYGDGVFAGRNDVHTSNIIGAARKTISEGLLGNCVTSWAVRIPNYETQHQWLYLAPLTIKNPQLSYQELLIKTSQDLFGVKSQEFFETISLVGYSFPFANEKSTGIQWTNLKDSRPAPTGFLKNLITDWQSKSDGQRWKDNSMRIKNAPEKIQDGITRLNTFISGSNNGFETLNAWTKAGYFQYWQSLVANEIVNCAEGKTEKSGDEIFALLISLRQDYKSWAETWMTKNSAEINSGLIFDAITEYFNNYK